MLRTLILVSTAVGFVSISGFTSLVAIAVGIPSSAVGIKICANSAGIQKYKSTMKNKRQNDKIVFLGKDKLNTIAVMISKALINSYIGHNELHSVNNVLKNIRK